LGLYGFVGNNGVNQVDLLGLRAECEATGYYSVSCSKREATPEETCCPTDIGIMPTGKSAIHDDEVNARLDALTKMTDKAADLAGDHCGDDCKSKIKKAAEADVKCWNPDIV